MSKGILLVGATIGGVAGAYIPVAFGASTFSVWSILGSTIGGLAGIIVTYRLGR